MIRRFLARRKARKLLAAGRQAEALATMYAAYGKAGRDVLAEMMDRAR